MLSARSGAVIPVTVASIGVVGWELNVGSIMIAAAQNDDAVTLKLCRSGDLPG
jgi:hypothetical protein